MRRYKMPRVRMNETSFNARSFAERITDENGIVYPSPRNKFSPEEKLCWRYVVFYASPNPKHKHFPWRAYKYIYPKYITGGFLENLTFVREEYIVKIAQEIASKCEIRHFYGTVEHGERPRALELT